jgi:hypothetical protein
LITARYNLAGAGTQNAGLAAGGNTGAGTALTCTEEYNGTSWSAGGVMTVSKFYLAAAGTQNEGIAFASYTKETCTEEYNGTSWSAGGAMSNSRYGSLAGAGSQNAGLAAGGTAGGVARSFTEEYNKALAIIDCCL